MKQNINISLKKWKQWSLKPEKSKIQYSNKMKDFYKNTKEYNPVKKRNALIVFDDKISNMISNKKPKELLDFLLAEEN